MSLLANPFGFALQLGSRCLYHKAVIILQEDAQETLFPMCCDGSSNFDMLQPAVAGRGVNVDDVLAPSAQTLLSCFIPLSILLNIKLLITSTTTNEAALSSGELRVQHLGCPAVSDVRCVS